MMSRSETTAREWLEKGREYSRRNDPGESLACFLRAVDLDPWCLDAYLGIGDVFMASGQFLEVLSAVNKAEERFGDHPWLLATRGHALVRLGLRRRALATYEKGCRLFPEVYENELFAQRLRK